MKKYIPILLVYAVVFFVLVTYKPQQMTQPEDLPDAVEIANRLGLHCRVDQLRVIVSEEQMSREQIEGLCVYRPWKGAVAIFPGRTNASETGTEGLTKWGGVYLYGDPALIERLTEARR